MHNIKAPLVFFLFFLILKKLHFLGHAFSEKNLTLKCLISTITLLISTTVLKTNQGRPLKVMKDLVKKM